MHILLVEPDVVLAAAYLSAFRSSGYSVDHATTAQKAIIVADERTPDLVILEIQLPNQNGIAFLQEFQSYSDWREVPVVFHTYVPVRSNGEAHQIMQHEFGIRHWLYKPQTSLSQLLATIKQYSPDTTEDVL